MSHAVAHAAQATRYLYSANRLKYPLVRRRLIELWRRAGAATRYSPDDAIQNDPQSAELPTGTAAGLSARTGKS